MATVHDLFRHSDPFGFCQACGPGDTVRDHEEAMGREPGEGALEMLTNAIWRALFDGAGKPIPGTDHIAGPPRDFFVVPADPFDHEPA